MRKLARIIPYKIVFPFLLLLLLILLVIFVPPIDNLIILLFLLIFSLFVYFTLKFFLKSKYSVLFSAFLTALLSLGVLGVLDFINIALLTSLFIGIMILLK